MIAMCRLCASLKKPELLLEITEQNICQKLEKCCQLQVDLNDALPKSVCQECLQCLNTSFQFYSKVKESQEILEAFYPTTTNDSDNGSLQTVTKAGVESKREDPNDPPDQVNNLKIENEKNINKDATNETSDSSFKITRIDALIPQQTESGISKSLSPKEVKQSIKTKNVKKAPEQNVHVRRKQTGNEPNIINNNLHKARQDSSSKNDVFIIQETVANTDNEDYMEEVYDILGITDDDIDDIHPKQFEEIEIVNVDENLVDVECENTEAMQIEEEVTEEEMHIEEEEENEEVEESHAKREFSSLPCHLQITNWNSYPYTCSACGSKTSSIIELHKHAKIAHGVDDIETFQYRCFDCQRSINSYSSFLNHIRMIHHPGLKLRCDACNIQCNDFESYESHRVTNCPNAMSYPASMPCKYCGKSFQSYNGLQTHIRMQHTKDVSKKEKYQCKKCDKQFSWESSLRNHKQIHSDNPQYQCPQCDKVCSTKANLKAHIDTHDTTRQFICHICQKSFKSDIILINHQLIHAKIKPFKCDFCSKGFLTKVQKNTHERTHTGEMPLQCPQCEKRFRFRSALNAHLKVHSGIRQFACTHCPKTFTDASNFKKHVRRKHSDC